MRILTLLVIVLLRISGGYVQGNLEIDFGPDVTLEQIQAIINAINAASGGNYTVQDSDECDRNGICPDGSTCFNSVGSYNCTCDSGYTSGGVGDNGDESCEDIDECNEDSTLCENIADAVCLNIPGSSECRCEEGFSINEAESACLDIDECAGDGNPCATISGSTCDNNGGSFECTCISGYGVNADMSACEDIDECDATIDVLHDCSVNEVCVNTDSSFTCQCAEGFTGNAGGACVDINECELLEPCDTNAICVNKDGGYDCHCDDGYFGSGELGECADVLSCSTFDVLRESILIVQTADADVDTSSYEQNLTEYNAANGLADGVYGHSFRAVYGTELTSHILNVIDDLRCDFFSTCSENTTADGTVYTCTCMEGYENTNGSETACQDTDECLKDPCGNLASCANNLGSYTCSCPGGYENPSDDVDADCMDIDECINATDNDCDENALCTNEPGTFNCTCNDGYMGSGKECESAVSCAAFSKVKSAIDTMRNAAEGEDTSEAETTLQYYFAATGKADAVSGASYRAMFGSNLGSDLVSSTIDLLRCDYFSTCTEEEGIDNEVLYACTCFSGYAAVATNMNQCADEDECALRDDACEGSGDCENAQGGFSCNCFAGFEGGESGPCKDIDECSLKTHECGATGTCENKDGGYSCSCHDGYEGGEDGPCTNIDECATSGHNCHADATCTDEIGSFTCECNVGHTGDGVACEDIDECKTGENTCDNVNGECTNTHGSFTCGCANGFMGTGYGEGNCEDVTTCDTFDKVRNAIMNVRNHANSTEDLEVLELYAAAVGKAEGVAGDTYRARFDPDNAGLPAAIESVIDDLRCDFFSTCSVNEASGESGITAFTDTGSGSGSGEGDSPGSGATTFMDGSGSGSMMYTCSCVEGYEEVDTHSNQCTDSDECSGENNCHPTRSTCTNTEGSYLCACNEGYSGDGKECEDIDECEDDSHTCDENAKCTNTDGLFECSCNTQYMGTGQKDECTSVLTCDAFQSLKDAIDIVQSSDSSDEDITNARKRLQEYNAATGKPAGVTQNAFRARFSDIDSDAEDVLDSLRCDYFSTCSFNESAYSCSCISGYEEDTENGGCKDINECTTGDRKCHSNATCTNVEGGFECECNEGYFGDGFEDGGGCSDHDECQGEGGGNDCDANATCKNVEGGHFCTCNATYFGDGRTCEEVNTCEAFNSVKSAIAVLLNMEAAEDEADEARLVLYHYHKATGKIGDVSGDSFRFKYPDVTDVDIENVVDALICDYHSNCEEGLDGIHTCTCYSDHIPAGTANTCLSVRSCNAFDMVKSAITTVTEGATEEEVETARQVLANYASASNHADPVAGTSYRARYGEITDDDLESALDLLPCDYFSTCTGSLSCSCLEGYEAVEEGSNACQDIDECQQDYENDCDAYATCSNTQGSHQCVCNEGFVGNGTSCEDEVECSGADDTLCGANAVCKDTIGSFSCDCSEGYAGDGQVCIQESECLFEEDSDDSVDDCSTTDHPLSCQFRKDFSARATLHFEAFRAAFIPPSGLAGSAADTRADTMFDAPTSSNGTSLCKKSTTYSSPSSAFLDANETDEVELFSYNCHRQWFTTTECTGAVQNLNAQCNTVKTPQSALVITKNETSGKYVVQRKSVYLPSSCQLEFV